MRRSGFRNMSKGQSMVEFALALPVLLLIVFGIIGFAHFFYVYFTVVSASREAARWGTAVGTSTNGMPRYKDCAAIVDAAVRVGALAGVDDSSVQVRYDKGPGDANNFTCPYDPEPFDRIKVSVTVDYTPLVPLVQLPSFPITATTKRTIMLARNVGEEPTGGAVQPMTMITLVPDPDPTATSSKTGQVQNFKVIVTASDGSAPTGTVTFKDTTTGQNSSCGASFSPPSPAGTAKVCSFTFNTIGAHNLVVEFVPTGPYIGPTPLTLVWMVASKLTTTSIVSIDPPNHQTQGAGVDVVVQVAVKAPDTGIPNGDVVLTFGDEFAAKAAVKANGLATFNDVALPKPGTHELAAVFEGNANFGSSQDSRNYTIIAQSHPVLTLSANPPSSLADTEITFTLVVKGPNVGDPIPAGSATISDNASHSCTAALNASGSMSCKWKYSSHGVYRVTATYHGDGLYDGDSTALDYTVSQLVAHDTQTKINVSPSSSFAFQPATITVQVTSPGGTPTGAVNITGPGGLSCPNPVPLDGSGRATCTHAYTQVNLPSYKWQINAEYISNNPSFKGSSGSVEHTVYPVDTMIFISANPDTEQYDLGDTVTFTVRVQSMMGGTPTGSVSLTGTGGLNCPNLTLTNGQASCSVTYSSYGTYLVSAVYHGDNSAFKNPEPKEEYYYAWPRPFTPPANCPYPTNGTDINFGTSKQMRFQITNPNSGVNQSVASIEVYWPNDADNTKLIETRLHNTTLSSSEHFPTIAYVTPTNGGSLNSNNNPRWFSAIFDHPLGSGIYVIKVNFTQNNCSLVVRSTR